LAPHANRSSEAFDHLNMGVKIGFLGIGIMGRGMALNLIKKGFDVTVWNRTSEKCQELVSGTCAQPPIPRNWNSMRSPCRSLHRAILLPESSDFSQREQRRGRLRAT
jgi:hypothetical protein